MAATQLAPGADVLAEAVRGLLEVSVLTTAPEAALRDAAETIRTVTAALSGQTRQDPWLPDRSHPRPSPYNAVLGVGNPLAPPAVLHRGPDGVHGSVRYGTAYEGAPGLVHGGILAMVMDQVLGEAAIAAGVPGMTVGLTLRYARPTPIRAELGLAGRVESVDGRKVTLAGEITLDGQPTCTATATFFQLSADQARELFPHLSRA